MQITLTPEQIQDILLSQEPPAEFHGITLEYFLSQYTYALKKALVMLTHLHKHVNKLQCTRQDVITALIKIGMSELQAQLFYSHHKAILNNEEIITEVAIKAVIKPRTRKQSK